MPKIPTLPHDTRTVVQAPVKETAFTLCVKKVEARPINPKALEELQDNAFVIKLFLKHPNDFLNQAEYELPGLMFSSDCYGNAILTMAYLEGKGDHEGAQAIIKHQIYAYARK